MVETVKKIDAGSPEEAELSSSISNVENLLVQANAVFKELKRQGFETKTVKRIIKERKKNSSNNTNVPVADLFNKLAVEKVKKPIFIL